MEKQELVNVQFIIDEKIENEEGLKENEFFEWLQGDKFPGAEIEDLGNSGSHYGSRWYKITYEEQDEEFYLDLGVFK